MAQPAAIILTLKFADEVILTQVTRFVCSSALIALDGACFANFYEHFTSLVEETNSNKGVDETTYHRWRSQVMAESADKTVGALQVFSTSSWVVSVLEFWLPTEHTASTNHSYLHISLSFCCWDSEAGVILSFIRNKTGSGVGTIEIPESSSYLLCSALIVKLKQTTTEGWVGKWNSTNSCSLLFFQSFKFFHGDSGTTVKEVGRLSFSSSIMSGVLTEVRRARNNTPLPPVVLNPTQP